jgi:ABC-type Fe3+/spermidine/putrescine transport system ATPase subunit
MTEPAIEATDLVREFKKGPRAVDGIDLRVEAGEVYGFLGPNGAGKSTTVHMLTTLLPPTSGSARVGGHDVLHEGPDCAPRSVPPSRRPRSTRSSPAPSTCACRPRCTASAARTLSPAPTRCWRGSA